MELLVANLSGRVKRQTMYGRPYLVANGTLIVPGVLNGSMGPLLYPEEEVKANPTAWNGMPLLVYHPSETGSSGRNSKTLNRQGVGVVLNAHFDKALKGEFWFDEERLRTVDSRVYDDLVNNRKIEISTGLKTTNEGAPENSVWNTPDGPVPYTHVARNYQPDHVAILPDQVGACSLKDGCGVLNVQDLRGSIDEAITRRFPGENPWIVGVYPSYAIYGTDQGLFKIGHSSVEGVTTLSEDDPVEVKQKTIYESVSNLDSQVGSSDSLEEEGEPTMANKMKDEERKTIIDGLISNSCCWTEEDRSELESMTDNQLKRTKESADKADENEELLMAAEKGFNDGRDEINFNREKREFVRKSTQQAENHQETKEPSMTPEQTEALNYGLQKMKEDKDALIKKIVANVATDQVTNKVAFLQNKGIEELRQIASLVPEAQTTQNHYGPNITGNRRAQQMDKEDMLGAPPEIDWTENSAFARSK